MLIYWTSVSQYRLLEFLVLIALTFTALTIDFHPRIAVAGSVMLILGLAQYYAVLENKFVPDYLTYLGRTPYSIFLVYFPISLVINAAYIVYITSDHNQHGLITRDRLQELYICAVCMASSLI